MAGPYIQLATFCENVLQEGNGLLSVIRAIDRVTITVQGGDAPQELPQGRLQLTLVISLRAGDALGRHPVTVRFEQPTGMVVPLQTLDVTFEGGERGVNLIINPNIDAMEGLFWFEVLVNDRLLTRVPLRVVYQRAPGRVS